MTESLKKQSEDKQVKINLAAQLITSPFETNLSSDEMVATDMEWKEVEKEDTEILAELNDVQKRLQYVEDRLFDARMKLKIALSSKEGWVFKKGPKSTMKKRILVLRGETLAYYTTQADLEKGKPAGLFYLRDTEISEGKDEKNSLQLRMKHCPNVYTLIWETEKEKKEWTDALKKAIRVFCYPQRPFTRKRREGQSDKERISQTLPNSGSPKTNPRPENSSNKI
jgi:hypothetical protein